MRAPVIQSEGLGKLYKRGMPASTGLLRDAIARAFSSPQNAFSRSSSLPETFWALKDVSIGVQEGEVLGLIGRNGSGKTTLLKILSRITQPTAGWAEIHGRVGSLLEVGTGFHSELTGRENTYLSGAILGMSKQEITRKFDEIVAFAELENFIDTPVKHYSSGMYVRLAFAVAAHLEPEILLVDEVLAVGDINFQKKCLGKMGDVAHAGRTIILVSHQLNQIRRLCHRTIWVDNGILRQAGPTAEVVSAYESAMASGERNPTEIARGPAGKGRFIDWGIVDPKSGDRQTLCSVGPVNIRFGIQIFQPIELGHHGIALFNNEGQLVWGNAKDAIRLNV
jgi:lipopolysaccharide transport system ATP-binding protein